MKTKNTALITGASSGIGLELSKIFAGQGYDLVLVARNQERLNALAEELGKEYGVAIHTFRIDLADSNAPKNLFDLLNQQEIYISALVNNAGFGDAGFFADQSEDRQLDMIQVNITALTRLARLFLPGMIERGYGEILNVASTAAFQPGPNMAVYYASKAYVLSFTEALAEELSAMPIKVSCLCPGPTRTAFAAESGMESSPLFKLAVMDAETVARAGFDGLKKSKVIIIPGLINKISIMSTRFFPRIIVRKIVKSLQPLAKIRH